MDDNLATVVWLWIWLKATAAVVQDAAELTCGFEASHSDCTGWLNISVPIMGFSSHLWRRANTLHLDAWHSISQPFDGEYFAFAFSPSGRPGKLEKFTLLSQMILCLPQPGVLAFFYWKNSFMSGFFDGLFTSSMMPMLRIYTAEFGQELKLVASIATRNQNDWKFISVDVPRSLKPFQIIIEGAVMNTFDVVALDDIAFRGDISAVMCNNEDSKLLTSFGLPDSFAQQPSRVTPEDQEEENRVDSTAVGSFVRRKPQKQIEALEMSFERTANQSHLSTEDNLRALTGWSDLLSENSTLENATQQLAGDCAAVNCNFEGDSCLYEGTDSDQGAWIIVEGRIGNPLTGISKAKQGSYYAVAYSNIENSTQTLRSKSFVTRAPTYLVFQYYFANWQGQLQLCDQSPDDCFWSVSRDSVSASSRNWQSAKLMILPGEHRLYWVVSELTPNYYAAVDQISLRVDADSNQRARCETMS